MRPWVPGGSSCDVSSTPLTASLDWIEFSRIKRGGRSTKPAKQSQAKASSIGVDVTSAVQYALHRRDPPFKVFAATNSHFHSAFFLPGNRNCTRFGHEENCEMHFKVSVGTLHLICG